MPTALEKNGFRFHFYSNDHDPMHMHVEHGDGEAVFDIAGEVTLKKSDGMKVAELREAEAIAVENAELLRRKWNEHFKK